MREKREYYGIAEIARDETIPPLKSRFTIMHEIDEGRLKAIKVGEGKATRWFIKHDDLFKFIKVWENKFN